MFSSHVQPQANSLCIHENRNIPSVPLSASLLVFLILYEVARELGGPDGDGMFACGSTCEKTLDPIGSMVL